MNTPEAFIFILFLSLGAFSLVAALFNIEWFFATHGAAMFIKWFGRKGARIFYVFLGLALLFCGVMGLMSLR